MLKGTEERLPLEPDRLVVRGDRGRSLAFLVSLILHVSLLLVLALWVYTAGLPSNGILVTANIAETLDSSFELSSDLAEEPEVAAAELSAIPEATTVSLDLELDSLLNKIEVAPAPRFTASLASVEVKDVADGLKTRGRGRGASFFGAYAEGNRFVYVLDSSSSMRGDRWTYARNKLLDSVQALTPEQEFFVLSFDSETTFLFNVQPKLAKFLRVEGDTVERLRRWLVSRGVALGPSTRPAEALKFALGMQPDAIFLLSDGELKDNSLLMLRAINGRFSSSPKIPIHTIHLFSNLGRPTLELIAQENSGTFTAVDGR